MTKKKKIFPERKYQYQALSIKVAEAVHQPNKSQPSNLAEAKEKFFRSGKISQFKIQDPSKLAELASKTKNQIRFNLLGEAEFILEKVKEEYGEGEYFLEHMFGSRITKEEATPMLLSYIEENSLSESIKINWCDNMPCSAKMVWTGPTVNANKPELRRYSLWINGSDDNNYMREIGIKCLMDHELGTHFFRMVNDGFQPWFSERSKFGLRNLGGFEGQCTEEGLATINTALRGRVKLLWGAALAYYTACKATEMTFKQLFDHIGRYISNPDARWKAVMRVKRGLTDPNDLGGFGNDQCYFEGAVTILRNVDKIDFNILMSGKICYDEIDRIKRIVRKNVIKVPVFMKNMNSYIKSLKKMAALNNLGEIHPLRSPPSAYLRRLDERRSDGTLRKNKKVRSSDKLKGRYIYNGHSKRMSKEDDIKEIKEVESFRVPGRFVNDFLQQKMFKEEERKRKEKDERIANLVDNLKDQIKCIDKKLGEISDDCSDIVKQHSWSSKENKEDVMSQINSFHELIDQDAGENNSSARQQVDMRHQDISNFPRLKKGNENETNNQMSTFWRDGCLSSLYQWIKVKDIDYYREDKCQQKRNLPCKSTPLVFSEDVTSDVKVHDSVEEIFNNKQLNPQKQKQLLHPSTALLTIKDSRGTQAKQVEKKLKLLKIASETKSIDKKCPELDCSVDTVCDNCVNCGKLLSLRDKKHWEDDLNSLKPTRKSDQDICFQSTQSTNSSLRLHRHKSYKYAQAKNYERCKPIPLYSDVTLAAVQLEATKEGSAFVTVTDFKSNETGEPYGLILRKNSSPCGSLSGTILNQSKLDTYLPEASLKLKQKP